MEVGWAIFENFSGFTRQAIASHVHACILAVGPDPAGAGRCPAARIERRWSGRRNSIASMVFLFVWGCKTGAGLLRSPSTPCAGACNSPHRRRKTIDSAASKAGRVDSHQSSWSAHAIPSLCFQAFFDAILLAFPLATSAESPRAVSTGRVPGGCPLKQAE